MRGFGLYPTVTQRLEIVKRRQAHKKLRDVFIRGAEEYLGEEVVTSILNMQESPIHDAELDSENEGIGPLRCIAEVENQILPFPSSLQNMPVFWLMACAFLKGV